MNNVQNSAAKTHDEPILQLKGISKAFPGVQALDQVDLDIRPGEVHALLGENGAGKSTLMKILAGKYTPDSGEIVYKGKEMKFSTPSDAIRNGIILIHQELSLVSQLTVAENIFLGNFPKKGFGRIDFKKIREQSRKILQELHCNFPETTIVGDLTIAKQQMVEIARALAFNPTVVIFDEPTASLNDQEKVSLFECIERLKRQGVAIIYISHRMDEIFAITDKITVLRDGKKTGTLMTANTNEDEVTQLMIGRKVEKITHEKGKQYGEEVLRLENLSSRGAFSNISFSIRAGEIVGLYGLVGAGRSEIAEAIFGVRKIDGGQIYINGRPVTMTSSRKAVKSGIGFVPESRKEQGLVLGMSVVENMTLAKIEQLQRAGFIQPDKELKIYDEYKKSLSVSTPGPNQKVVNLSGGNQQKVVIAKWLTMAPKLLILDEPTRGIDVGSKAEIHKLIRKLGEEGYAILVISSEMPEIMAVSDRVLTLYAGRITGELVGEEITENNLIQGIMKADVPMAK